MRTIEWATAFKRDYKREKKGPHGQRLDVLIETAVTLLANDRPLPESFRDHPLVGQWDSYRDCHLRPDLVLIYKKLDRHTLQLARLGSHANIFGS